MSLLELKNVNKIFSKGTINENHVLKDLCLNVEEGDFISIIGGNGAGKSTLLNSIAGVLKIDSGNILLNNKSIKNQSVHKRSKDISRVFQDPKMGTAGKLSVERNMSIAYKRGKKRGLSLGVKEKEVEIFKKSLKELGLSLEDRLKVDANFLSGGQRQALTLAMATIVKPKILLLDEHTAALDPKTSDMVMALTDKIIKEQKLTALMITHNMEHAIKYGNRLIMLHQGKIVVDIKKEDKQNLSVSMLMELFHKNSGSELLNDSLILS